MMKSVSDEAKLNVIDYIEIYSRVTFEDNNSGVADEKNL